MAKGAVQSATDLDDPQQFNHPALALLDGTLRCPICSEHYSAPLLITACSHSFCSLCLRQAMQLKKVCPKCNAPADEGRMKPNKALDEIVQAWHAARSALLTLQSFSTATGAAPSTSSSPRATSSTGLPPPSRSYTTRASASAGKGKRKASAEDDSSDIEIMEAGPSSTAAAVTSKAKGKGKKVKREKDSDPADPNLIVSCPVCDASFRNVELNRHMNDCLAGKKSKPSTRSNGNAWGKLLNSSTSASGVASGAKDREKGSAASPHGDTTKPLPLVSYAGLKATALKKKLEDLSLPTTHSSTSPADKLTFYLRRHRQWTTLWNANADFPREDARHRDHAGLVKELLRWEKVMDDEKGGKREIEVRGYEKEHEEEFRALIKQARESARVQKEAEAARARAEEVKCELGDLAEEQEEEESFEARGEGEGGVGDVEMAEEEAGKARRPSATVRFADVESTPPPPLSSPTPQSTTHTHTLTRTRSPTPTGSLAPSFPSDDEDERSPSPPYAGPGSQSTIVGGVMDEKQQKEEEKERREATRRKREFSPFDPRGPRPSQRVRGEGSGLLDDDEDAEEEVEDGEEG